MNFKNLKYLEGHQCIQTETGVICEDPRMNKTMIQSSFKSYGRDYIYYDYGENYNNKEDTVNEKFNSFQLGVSIALSVMGTLIAIGCVYAVIQMRR